MKLQDVFSHFRADITIASDMGIKHFTASCWKADGIVWKFPHEYWVFARFWQSFVLWHAGKKGLFQRLFVRNRKFTFYPLLFHKRGVHYYQSKDIDWQTPNITSHPIPIKSLRKERGGFWFLDVLFLGWCFSFEKRSRWSLGAFDFWVFFSEAFLWKSTLASPWGFWFLGVLFWGGCPERCFLSWFVFWI